MCEDNEERRALMSFVAVSTGATGNEMTGTLAELAQAAVKRDFRRIDPAAARILLVEAGPRVLTGFALALGKYAATTLRRTGIQLLLNTKLDHADDAGVTAGGRPIEAKTVAAPDIG